MSGPLTTLAMETPPASCAGMALMRVSEDGSVELHPMAVYEAAKAEKDEAWDLLETLRYGACLSAETVLAQYDENDKESLAEAMEILRDSLAKVKAAEERYTRALDASVSAAQALSGGDR